MKRIAPLDSLRGLAALFVFFGHLTGAFGPFPGFPSWLGRSPFAFVVDGFAGVSLFFVLSGFVLTLKYFRGGFSARMAPAFLINRVLRIVPPFVGVLLLSFAAFKFFAGGNSYLEQTEWIRQIWPQSIASHDVLRQTFLPRAAASPHLLPQDWTLTIELNVSIMIPLMIWLTLKSPALLLLFVASLLKNRWYLIHFTVGLFIACYLPQLQNRLSSRKAFEKLILFLVSFILYSSRFSFAAEMQIPDYFIWVMTGIGSAGIILTALCSETAQNFLQMKPLVYLGRISYSLYLVQFIVIKTFSPRIPAGYFTMFFTSTAAVIGLSSLCYVLLEKPSIRAGKVLSHLASEILIRLMRFKIRPIIRSP